MSSELDEVYAELDWGVIFLDQHPEDARVQVARLLKGRADFVVMHDSYRQLGQKGFPRYEDLFAYTKEFFPARPFPALAGPPTLVGSDRRDPAALPADPYTYDQWCHTHNAAGPMGECKKNGCTRGGWIQTKRSQEGRVEAANSFVDSVSAALDASAGDILLLVDADASLLRKGRQGVLESLLHRACESRKDNRSFVLGVHGGGPGAWEAHTDLGGCAIAMSLEAWGSGNFDGLGKESSLFQDGAMLRWAQVLEGRWGLVLLDAGSFEHRSEILRELAARQSRRLRRDETPESGGWEWLAVHDAERLLKTDLLRVANTCLLLLIRLTCLFLFPSCPPDHSSERSYPKILRDYVLRSTFRHARSLQFPDLRRSWCPDCTPRPAAELVTSAPLRTLGTEFRCHIQGCAKFTMLTMT